MSGSGTVIVTGGNSGIGACVVEQILESEPEKVCAVLDVAPAAHQDERVHNFACDVSDAAAVERAVGEITELGPVSSLVAAAGIHLYEPALTMTPDEWDRMIGVHLSGTLFVAQHVGRSMQSTGGGAMVFFSSAIAPFGHPGRVAYSVSKAGIEAMAKTLAVELASDGIRVNAVAPGYISTPFVEAAERSGAIDMRSVLEEHAMGRMGDATEVADAVLFLLGDRASFITGEVLRVDGGFAVTKMPFQT